MILQGPNLTLVPFAKTDAPLLYQWFYDERYQSMFRHNARVMTLQDFEIYPQFLAGAIFIIYQNSTKTPIGYTQIIPEIKTSRGFTTGILITEEAQGNRHPTEAIILLANFAFNRLGYHKMIVEILESNRSLVQTVTEAKFLFEGKLLGEAFYKGEFVNELRYCMFNTFFNKHYGPIIQSWAKQ